MYTFRTHKTHIDNSVSNTEVAIYCTNIWNNNNNDDFYIKRIYFGRQVVKCIDGTTCCTALHIIFQMSMEIESTLYHKFPNTNLVSFTHYKSDPNTRTEIAQINCHFD